MIEIITGIAFAFFFTEMHQFHKKWKLDFRPFNCVSCLSAWSSLVLYLLPDIIKMPLLIMFISGTFAPLFVKLYNNYFYGTK
jgi:hypothetical protein